MNILTFDIEEWYTYTLFPKGGSDFYLPIINNILEKVLDLLDEIDVKATFFCLGMIAHTNPQIITRIANRGHEIGCHSDKHLLISKMTPTAFAKDTHIAVDSLEQLIGQKIEFYRAPAFSITQDTLWALEILMDEGITCDSSIFPASRRFGGLPSFKAMQPAIIEIKGNFIKEFPISYATFLNKKFIFSGGGYFRLFPYWAIKSMMLQSEYHLAYFHIRDFDREQMKIKNMNYFMSYYGISSAFNKFDKFIRDFKFIPLSTAVQKTNWSNAPKVILN